MNITFMIGNGFDINIGLNTDYKSFLNYYLEQVTLNEKTKEPDEDILAFKKLISEDIEYWSALEKALGEMSVVEPLNTVEGLIKCKRDLDRQLKDYLVKQQERVDYSNKNAYGAAMSKSLEHFRLSLKPMTERRLTSIFDRFSAESIVYNAITFNYTNVFRTVFSAMSDPVGTHNRGTSSYRHNKGKMVHIHGTTELSMIVGVNDESQIKNEDLARDKRVQAYMIKPRMNELSKEARNEEAISAIDASAIIVLFGMSIGETDKYWWKYIAKHMLKVSHCQLIIIDYIRGYDPTFPYDAAMAEEEVVDRFLKTAEVSEEEGEQLRSRIDAVFNTSMFKLNLQIKPLEKKESGIVA